MQEGAEVADVAVIVNGRAAGVHAERPERRAGDERFDRGR